MSHGVHNSAHHYNGPRRSRGTRLRSKLGQSISLKRLERLLATKKSSRPTKGMIRMSDDPKPDPDPDSTEEQPAPDPVPPASEEPQTA